VNGKAQRGFGRRKQVAARLRLGQSAWQRVIASAITSRNCPSTASEGRFALAAVGVALDLTALGGSVSDSMKPVNRECILERQHLTCTVAIHVGDPGPAFA
jgi:hypothetical protein